MTSSEPSESSFSTGSFRFFFSTPVFAAFSFCGGFAAAFFSVPALAKAPANGTSLSQLLLLLLLLCDESSSDSLNAFLALFAAPSVPTAPFLGTGAAPKFLLEAAGGEDFRDDFAPFARSELSDEELEEPSEEEGDPCLKRWSNFLCHSLEEAAIRSAAGEVRDFGAAA